MDMTVPQAVSIDVRQAPVQAGIFDWTSAETPLQVADVP